ncbi:hypothetical protein ABMA28_001643 [Loxostege sticticalis]|uniref:Uncharacterized protein n=1 Tax=Loxostege sticticalis TaxID=481309 RepID=A0ABD0T2E3_LOXSC
MKKLERKILRASRRSSESSSSDRSGVNESVYNPQGRIFDGSISIIADDEIIDVELRANDEEPLADMEPLSLEPIASTSAAADAADAAALAAVRAASAAAETENQLNSDAQNAVSPEMPLPLDDETLAILGDDPSAQKSYGEDIHKDLAVRLEHIATTGLTKEIRKELQNKYLPPANSTLVDAPALNPEIKAAVSDAVAKRDKGIEIKQKQVANAISCIGQATTHLLSQDGKNPTLLKLLMDANRILCDCQYLDSVTRRNFILATLKKDMRDQLQTTKIDTMLFGKNFAETIKTAKAISKSGADLKSNPNIKPATKKTKSFPPTNLNWKAPPPKGRPPGTQRTQQPASQKSHRAPSSRVSQPQPAPSRSRR